MSSSAKVIAALNATGVPYEILEIDPEFSDTTVFCQRFGYPLSQTCNTIIVTSKRGPTKFAACVVLAHTRLDVNNRVKNLLGTAKAGFASAEDIGKITGMEIGGVTPIGLPADLPLYVDERVMKPDWIILGGGSRDRKLKVAPIMLSQLGAEVVPHLALEVTER